MIILHTRFGRTQVHLNVTIIMGRFNQILFWILTLYVNISCQQREVKWCFFPKMSGNLCKCGTSPRGHRDQLSCQQGHSDRRYRQVDHLYQGHQWPELR